MLSTSLVIRVLRLIWTAVPFLMTLVFDDRPVREVLRENLYFTIIFVLFSMTTLTAVWTTSTLGKLRLEHYYLERRYRDLIVEHAQAVERNRLHLAELEMCTYEDDYDPYRALRRLDPEDIDSRP